jgi:hypothetical protein
VSRLQYCLWFHTFETSYWRRCLYENSSKHVSIVLFIHTVMLLCSVQQVPNIVCHLGFEALTAVAMKSSVTWNIMPYSPVKFNRRFGEMYLLHLQGRKLSKRIRYKKQAASSASCCFKLVSCLFYNLALKMEAICFSKTSVDFRRTTRRYIQ